MANNVSQLPQPTLQWINSNGTPTLAFAQFMTLFATNPLGLVSAANDAAAAKVDIAIGQIYLQNGVPFARMK